MARGFQEVYKPRSNLCMVVNDSLKLLIALAGNKDFDLGSIDIRATFLQGNTPD